MFIKKFLIISVTVLFYSFTSTANNNLPNLPNVPMPPLPPVATPSQNTTPTVPDLPPIIDTTQQEVVLHEAQVKNPVENKQGQNTVNVIPNPTPNMPPLPTVLPLTQPQPQKVDNKPAAIPNEPPKVESMHPPVSTEAQAVPPSVVSPSHITPVELKPQPMPVPPMAPPAPPPPPPAPLIPNDSLINDDLKQLYQTNSTKSSKGKKKQFADDQLSELEEDIKAGQQSDLEKMFSLDYKDSQTLPEKFYRHEGDSQNSHLPTKVTRETYAEACMFAIDNDSLEDLKSIVETMDLKQIVDYEGNDLLIYAVMAKKTSIIDWLLTQHIDINHQNAYGATALHAAVINNDKITVTKLLKHNVHYKLTDKNNMQAGDYAKELGRSEIASIIDKYDEQLRKKEELKAEQLRKKHTKKPQKKQIKH